MSHPSRRALLVGTLGVATAGLATKANAEPSTTTTHAEAIRKIFADINSDAYLSKRPLLTTATSSRKTAASNLGLEAPARRNLDIFYRQSRSSADTMQADHGVQVLDASIQVSASHTFEGRNGQYELITLAAGRKLSGERTWVEPIHVLLTTDDSGDVRDLQVGNDLTPWVRNRVNGLVPTSAIEISPSLDIEVGDPVLSAEDFERLDTSDLAVAPMALGKTGRAKAAAYADRYWSSGNSAFRDFTKPGGDCTNFVSQCMRAGGWGDVGNAFGIYSTNAWFYWNSPATQSRTWVNVGYFRDFAYGSGRTQPTNHVTNLWHGNVLQIKVGDTWTHSAIVTGRANNLPLLTYRTNNVHNRPFTVVRDLFAKSGHLSWAMHLT